MHRLDLSLYFRPKDLEGNGVRTHVNCKGKKTTSTGKILLRGGSNPRRCIEQDNEPNTLPTSYSGPRKVLTQLALASLLTLEVMRSSCSTLLVNFQSLVKYNPTTVL